MHYLDLRFIFRGVKLCTYKAEMRSARSTLLFDSFPHSSVCVCVCVCVCACVCLSLHTRQSSTLSCNSQDQYPLSALVIQSSSHWEEIREKGRLKQPRDRSGGREANKMTSFARIGVSFALPRRSAKHLGRACGTELLLPPACRWG